MQRGVSLFKVQELLGHSDTRMTQNTPSSIRGGSPTKVVEIFDNLGVDKGRLMP